MKRTAMFALALLLGCGSGNKQHNSSPGAISNRSAGIGAAPSNAQALGTWFLAGATPQEYQWAGDPTGTPADSLSLSSSSADANAGDFGTVMTDVDPAAHRGKRLQLTATLRTQGASGWGGLWMRVDGPTGAVFAFDNMQNRPLQGTQAAESYSVVLDIDPNAVDIAYGVLMVGPGLITASSLQIQEVPTSVPTTNLWPSPGQWFLAGSDPANYQMNGDPTGTQPDSLTLSSSSETYDQFGTAMTKVDATAYQGMRVQLQATVRTAGVTGWAGLWMRVDGPTGAVFNFDNMENRALGGTLSAGTYSVVLDVDPNATGLAYGILLSGPGEVTVSDLTVAVVNASVPTTGFFSPGWPWGLGGSNPSAYQASGDVGASPDGLILSSSTSPAGQFGSYQSFGPATPFLGKRVRLQAIVRTQGVTSWSGLWMRVDGANGAVLAFDNMQNRPLTGTQAAEVYSVVLDVDPSATGLAYGVLLDGPGEVTVSALSLEIVDDSVPTT